MKNNCRYQKINFNLPLIIVIKQKEGREIPEKMVLILNL